MENGFGSGSEALAAGGQQPEQTNGTKPHWTARPQKMLLAVLACQFVIYLITAAASLLISQAFSNLSQSELGGLTAVFNALILCPSLVVSALFYWLVRRSQLRHGTAEAVSWKPGVAFWVGLGLTLLYFALYGIRFLLNFSSTAAMLLYSAVVSGLSLALFISLLFPVMEKRFGALNGALIISVSFALLAVLERLANSMFSLLHYASETGGMGGQMAWSSFAVGLVSAFITAASLGLLRSALYLAASRRISGTWLLFSSVPGLVTMLYGAIAASLPGSSGLSGWMLTLCVQFPYDLLVLALSMGVLAGFQRWKTPGEFFADFRTFIMKAKRTQNDIGD